MPETYEEVEKRISEAIAAINSRENVNRKQDCPRIPRPSSKIAISTQQKPTCEQRTGLHLRKLAPDQEKALHDYFVQLDKTGMPARLHMIEQAANSLLRMSSDPAAPPPFVAPQWAKRWKPLAAAGKNAHDPELLMEYFMT